jgi:hypothetical protein
MEKVSSCILLYMSKFIHFYADVNVMSSQASLQSPTESNKSGTDIRFDDIRTEFHPASGKEPVVAHFEDYGHTKEFTYTDPPNLRPWAPFQSRLDFEIAELILLAALNKEQTTKLISLLKRVAEGDEEFTLESHADIKKKWEGASDICTQVSQTTKISQFNYIDPMYSKVSKGNCGHTLQEC